MAATDDKDRANFKRGLLPKEGTWQQQLASKRAEFLNAKLINTLGIIQCFKTDENLKFKSKPVFQNQQLVYFLEQCALGSTINEMVSNNRAGSIRLFSRKKKFFVQNPLGEAIHKKVRIMSIVLENSNSQMCKYRMMIAHKSGKRERKTGEGEKAVKTV